MLLCSVHVGVGDASCALCRCSPHQGRLRVTLSFVCGLNRASFDNRASSFEAHVSRDHNLWNYLYFVVHLRLKDATEYNGPESFVSRLVATGKLDWFPRLRTRLLQDEGGGEEQSEVSMLRSELEASRAVFVLALCIVLAAPAALLTAPPTACRRCATGCRHSCRPSATCSRC